MTSSRTTASNNAARVAQEQARRALDRVTGLTADRALKILRFSPGRPGRQSTGWWRRPSPTSAGISRGGRGRSRRHRRRVTDGEAITRVRRHAHGNADWITTYTTAIEVELALSDRPGLTLVHPAAADDQESGQ